MSDFVSSSSSGQPEVTTFGRAGLKRGVQKTIPVALGVCAYGLIFGVLARQAGLSVLEVLLMSALVYAGSAQLLVLSLWHIPSMIIPILFTTLLVNLRNLLFGVSVSPWFKHLSTLKAYITVFWLTDESWALMMSDFSEGGHDGAFLLGSGIVLFIAWISSTVAGRLLGEIMPVSLFWGLDFAFTAVFLTLLVGMWKGKQDIIPWLVAAIVAGVTYRILPGNWYIRTGALAGSVVGVIRHAD